MYINLEDLKVITLVVVLVGIFRKKKDASSLYSHLQINSIGLKSRVNGTGKFLYSFPRSRAKFFVFRLEQAFTTKRSCFSNLSRRRIRKREREGERERERVCVNCFELTSGAYF